MKFLFLMCPLAIATQTNSIQCLKRPKYSHSKALLSSTDLIMASHWPRCIKICVKKKRNVGAECRPTTKVKKKLSILRYFTMITAVQPNYVARELVCICTVNLF